MAKARDPRPGRGSGGRIDPVGPLAVAFFASLGRFSPNHAGADAQRWEPFGSGRRSLPTAAAVEERQAFTMADWGRGAAPGGLVVEVAKTPQRLGGERIWLVCPSCRRRCARSTNPPKGTPGIAGDGLRLTHLSARGGRWNELLWPRSCAVPRSGTRPTAGGSHAPPRRRGVPGLASDHRRGRVTRTCRLLPGSWRMRGVAPTGEEVSGTRKGVGEAARETPRSGRTLMKIAAERCRSGRLAPQGYKSLRSPRHRTHEVEATPRASRERAMGRADFTDFFQGPKRRPGSSAGTYQFPYFR